MKISKKTIAELSDEYSKIGNAHEFLNELGRIIRAELVGLGLIGEIERPEGKDTYDALKNALKKFYRIKKMGDFDPAYIDSPDRRAVLSLYFVWAGVFNYGADGGHDFWPHVFNELGFRYVSAKSSECGKLFLECLKENDLETFPKISGLVYVSRILLHGLIPEKHIGKFIENFILKELSGVSARYRTGQGLVSMWSKDWRFDMQPVPVQNFIRHGRPINGDVVDRFWDMIENWEDEATEFWRRWRLPKYMVDAFASCLDSSGTARRIGRKKTFAGRPFLTFDFQRNDFPTLCVPSQPIASGSRLRIESETLNRGRTETTERLQAIRLRDELVFQGRDFSVPPSREWTVVLPGKPQTVVHQFPEDDSGCEIPVFFFNNGSGKTVNFVPGKPFPKEIMAVFPEESRFAIDGAEMLTPEIALSHSWHDWICATYRLGENCRVTYHGPDIGFSKTVESEIQIVGKDADRDIPFLDSGQTAPSWVRTDGNIPIVTDVRTLVVRFSDTARKAWRGGMGKIVRLDLSAPNSQNAYFDLDFRKVDRGFVSQPEMLRRIDPGAYEIRIRGALGMEDVVLPFVYIPVSKFDRRGAAGDHEIHDRFVLDFATPMALDPFSNNKVQWQRENQAVVALEEDNGEAFCALKLFKASKFPVTLLLARGPARWVRRSEEGLFHWYDWRSQVEEIPIDRLNELSDTRVLVEIDDSRGGSVAKIHKKSNRLRLLLRSMDWESQKNGTFLMSLNAMNYKRGLRDIWVLDLQKFADQITSIKEAGNAELVLYAYGSFPKIVLFRLLRYSKFENFRVRSKRLDDKIEVLEANWDPHPNEVRKNRKIALFPNGDEQNRLFFDIPDNKKPPLAFEVNAPEKPEMWTAKIEVRRSRFGGRFSRQTPNAACQLPRMPQGWKDWLESPEDSYEKRPSWYEQFIRVLGMEKAWPHLPWSSFLDFFNIGGCKNHFDELTAILGIELMKNLFPFSKNRILRIRNGSQTVARIRILSDIPMESGLTEFFKSLPPAKWCRMPDKFSFYFSTIPSFYSPTFPSTSDEIYFFSREGPKGEPVIKTGKKEVPFFQWLAMENDFRASGNIVMELPLGSIWAKPIEPDIFRKVEPKDAFSFGNLCLVSSLDGAKPIQKSFRHNMKKQTTMAAAFAECIENKKIISDQAEMILPYIGKETRNSFHKLISRWDDWSNRSSAHLLIRKMIEIRLKNNPLDALSGAAALICRFPAHGYGQLTQKTAYEGLFNDTIDFAAEYLPKSFLRDLVLSEIIISWYWDKRYLEFNGVSKSKSNHSTKAKKNIHSVKKVVVSDHTKNDLSFLNSEPRNLALQDVNKIWRQKGFFLPGNNSMHLKREELDFVDKGDDTILDLRTGLLWQKQGAEKPLSWTDSRKYVNKLNRREFAGYRDWRIPTLEELGSLLMPSKDHGQTVYTARFISEKFCKKQIICWSSDSFGKHFRWYVNFFSGRADNGSSVKNRVRAVRTYELASSCMFSGGCVFSPPSKTGCDNAKKTRETRASKKQEDVCHDARPYRPDQGERKHSGKLSQIFDHDLRN